MPFRLMLAIVLCLSSASLAMAQADHGNVVESLTGQRVAALLGEAGFPDSEVDDDGDVTVTMQGYRVLFLVGSYDGKNIAARFALGGTEATADTVNRFDKDKRFGRAFLDDEGDPVLESDLDLEGGVTEARVKDFFRTYNELMVHFLRAVL